jgi:hypothetical protein
MALLVWPPPDHLWIGPKSRQFLPSQRCASMTKRPHNIPRGDSGIYARAAYPPTSQLKRERSPSPKFGWIPGNPCDLSKAYFATTFLSSSLTWPATQSGLYHTTYEDQTKPRGTAIFNGNGSVSVFGIWRWKRRSGPLSPTAIFGVSFLVGWFEHVAGVDDFEVAEATCRAAVARWPAARITLRQGARVMHESG